MTSARAGRNSPRMTRLRRSGRTVGTEPVYLHAAFWRALANQPSADLNEAMNPLRLSYTMFADRNP